MHLLEHAEDAVAAGGGGLRSQFRETTKRRHRHALLLHWSENNDPRLIHSCRG